MSRILISILLIVSLAVSAYFFISYGKESYPFYGDAMGYYMYLPSTFIYHNHKALDWLPTDKHVDGSVRSYLRSLRNTPRTPKGYIIDKYTYGVAAMELPFFFIAHGYEKLFGREANGYSAAYRTMLKISTFFYALAGSMILYKILSSFFNRSLALAGTLVIFMGTNLFWFTVDQQGMAHVPLFFLYALLIYTTILIHQKPKAALFALAGLAAGFITLIRPTDIVCLLIPLLFNVYNKDTLAKKKMLLKENYKSIILFVLAFITPLVPQMLYWKKFAGSFLYYSYKNENFNWLSPKIFQGLFSFTNGWLIYSPVMLFSILGVMFYKRIKSIALIIFILVPVYIYIIYSWYCYNYTNGLGSRPMIHLYPLLAIPLTAFIQYVVESKLYLKLIFFPLLLLFVSLNVSYSLQEAKEILISEESFAKYNIHMLFKTDASYNDLVLYDVRQVQPAGNTVEKITTLACENYEDSISDHFVPDPTGNSKFVYHMLGNEEYHPKTIVVKYNKALFKGGDWLKCSGTFLCTKPYFYFKHLLTLEIIRGDKTIRWTGCKIDNKIGLTGPNVDRSAFYFGHMKLNIWGNVSFYIKVPKDIADGDKIRLDVWNIGKQEIYFDNICLDLYRNKR